MEDTPSVSRRSALRLLALAQEEEEEEERRRMVEKREMKEKKEKKDMKEKRGGWGRGDEDWSPKLRGSHKKNRPRNY